MIASSARIGGLQVNEDSDDADIAVGSLFTRRKSLMADKTNVPIAGLNLFIICSLYKCISLH